MVGQDERTAETRTTSDGAERIRAMRRWEGQRAHGRSSFVWRSGVVGWGFPAALLTAAYKVFQEQGLDWPVVLSGDLQRALLLIAVVFPALGYLFGGWLWTKGEAHYERLRELEERRARHRTPAHAPLPTERGPRG